MTAPSSLRGWLYDRLVSGLTADWYRAVLTRLPDAARLLDVGIGTGAALASCADLVQAKRLRVVGLDIDPDYLHRCASELARAGLTEWVRPELSSVYDHDGGPYDAAYFSASLMLLPDPVGAITHVASLLRPGGRLFSTQTFEHRRSPLMERVKPMAKHLTTIHFGRVTYEEEFRSTFSSAGVELVELITIGGSRSRSHRMAVARPMPLPRAHSA